ncbi:MAG: hypothetical protein LIP08_14990 [Bacteroides sp.]|nr:hypothetical protein [Bacteroides sp.]
MNLNTHLHSKEEWIELYLSGELLDVEKKEFENVLRQDPTLGEEVELMRHIVSGFHHKGEVAVIEELRSISSEEELQRMLDRVENRAAATKKKKYRRKFWYSVTAVAVVLALLYIGYQPRYTVSQVYQTYYVAPPYETFPTRGVSALDEWQQECLAEAVSLYEKENYRQASLEFEKIVQTLPEENIPEEILFYSSVCLLELKQPANALSRLQLLALCEACEFQEAAQWQMVWAHILLEQRDEAERLLRDKMDQTNTDVYARPAKDIRYMLQKKKMVLMPFVKRCSVKN